MSVSKIFIVCMLCAVGVISIELPEKSNSKPLSWWQEEIVYQVYPRSHQDSDGDGVGDLKGIENRLDHFVDIGVGSVWISPIYKSPMVDFGYDISDFRDIDPTFGTMADFESLSAAMKEKGIKLIMDFVPNHSSDQHEWFKQSVLRNGSYTDYYVWKDKKGDDGENQPIPPNNWRSVFGGSAWEWNDERQQFYLHQFTVEQPDLNFNNDEVRAEILKTFMFWMEKGVDGFRVDAVPHIFEDQSFADEEANPNPPANANCTFDYACLLHDKTYNLPGVLTLLADVRRIIDIYSLKDKVERVMMVEATIPTLDGLFEYYGTSKNPIANYPFNFEFIGRIKPDFTGNDIDALINEWFTKMPPGNTANWLLGNHDNGRVGSRFTPDVIDPFNMINLLLPGSAVTYYGEEIGMLNVNISFEDTVDPPGCIAGPDRYHLFSRDPARTPMQWNGRDTSAGFSTNETTWLPMSLDWKTVNVESQLSSATLTHLQVYKAIVELRKTDIWRFGAMETKTLHKGDVFGFSRTLNATGGGFVYLANFADQLKTINLESNFKNVPSTPNAVKLYMTSVGFTPAEVKIGDSIHSNKVISIGPKHALILLWGEQNIPSPSTTEGTTVTESEGTGGTGETGGTGTTATDGETDTSGTGTQPTNTDGTTTPGGSGASAIQFSLIVSVVGLALSILFSV